MARRARSRYVGEAMRTILALVAFVLAAACAAEAPLCSEDPACAPIDCGPRGCGAGAGRGGSGGGGAGGAGGAGGTGGVGGAGGADAPPVCTQMCERVYVLCGSLLYDATGVPLTHDECVESCAAGAPSQAQAACIAEAVCGDFARCLDQVPAPVCDAVCERIYGICQGALVVDGRLVDAGDCPHVCPTGLTAGEASCILGASCEDWLLCVR